MCATSSNSSSRVVNASSSRRSSLPLPARSTSPPSSYLLIERSVERRETQEEKSNRELLESLMRRREALCRERDFIDREVQKLREKLSSDAQDVIVASDNDDESDSEAPPAKPVERRANNKKRPHVFDDDEEVVDNYQGVSKRLRGDQISLEVDYNNLSIRQKLAIVLNSFGTNSNVLTSEILLKYQQKFDASAKWENIRSCITKLRNENFVQWNENTSCNSRYKVLKRI